MASIPITEGKIGFADNDKELRYPSVTSCLTITCVTKDGGKWGAHMSLNHAKDGFTNSIILQELRAMMSQGKAIIHVEKVWIVGKLDMWKTSLIPAGLDAPARIDIDNDDNISLNATSDRLVQVLGLNHMHGMPSGSSFDKAFVFMACADGDVLFSSGCNPGQVGVKRHSDAIFLKPDDF